MLYVLDLGCCRANFRLSMSSTFFFQRTDTAVPTRRPFQRRCGCMYDHSADKEATE